jgi:hypothetical protein
VAKGRAKLDSSCLCGFDLKQGGLQGPLLTDSRQADQRSALRKVGILAGVLNINDESSCRLEWLKEQDGFFLTRPNSRVCFLDRQSGQEAKRRGKAQANPEVLKRAKWTMVITTVPAHLLTISEMIVLQRARWQIERFFRLWKEGGTIYEWRGRTSWRILCEIYAKVIAMLIQHWLVVLGTWHDPYRSLVKAAKLVRQHG